VGGPQFPIAIRRRAVSFCRLTMKTWAALVLIPIILCVTGCEKHPVSDLQKVDSSFENQEQSK
jgi:hypothetical protein